MTSADNESGPTGHDLTGKVLKGRYRVSKVLGESALSTVYLAKDEELSRLVAVKVPGARFLGDARFAERFATEVKSLLRLEHPNLVRVVDVGSEGGVPFAVLQYLPGGSLKERIADRAGRFTRAEVEKWLPHVATALDFVHRQGVIHRGVKPGNILFDAEGNPFLGDFGIVKTLGEKEANATITLGSAGPSVYAAPEAAKPGDLTPAYDQYGLASAVYEMLAGAPPFAGKTGIAALVAKQTAEAPSVLSVLPDFPRGAAAAVARALSRDPAQRFKNCVEFATAFGAAEAATAPAATAPAPAAAPAAATSSSSEPAGGETKVISRAEVAAATRAAASGVAAPAPAPVAAAPAAAPSDGGNTKRVGKDGKPAKGSVPVGVIPRTPSKGPMILKVVAGIVVLLVGAAWWIHQNQEAPRPGVRFTSPEEGKVVRKPEVTVKGQAWNLSSSDKLQIEGQDVPVFAGVFEKQVTLKADGDQKIVAHVVSGTKVVATAAVMVKFEYAWKSIMEEVRVLFTKGDWAALTAKIGEARAAGAERKDVPPDIREAIARREAEEKDAAAKRDATAKAAKERYDAPPILTIDKPVDGFATDKAVLRVEGTFSSGRDTDVVKVDGKEVTPKDGRYAADVTFTASTSREIEVVVEDAGQVRRKASVRVTYTRPKDVWEDFLAGWATPVGTETDTASGFPKRIARTKDGGEMVLVPAGASWIGTVPNAKTQIGDEQPGHRVTFSKAYYVDVTEVTVGQWRKFVASGEGKLPNLAITGTKDDFPVYNVSHPEVTAFARWAGVNLPTEAQWERAARAGHDDWVFPWGMEDDATKRNAEGVQDEFEKLAPVKKFPPNDFGLYDVSGNVWEWVADWYDAKYYTDAPASDPPGPATGTQRVVRGGSYDRDPLNGRTSKRMPQDPNLHGTSFGFRCAKTLP